MKSQRLNSAILESKSQHQKRSLNQFYSPDTFQCSVHISGSGSPNEQFFLAYKRRHLSYIQASQFSDQDHFHAFSICNIQVLFHVLFLLISCLCFSFPLLLLVNLYHNYVLILFIYVLLLHDVQLSLICQGEKVSLMVLKYV